MRRTVIVHDEMDGDDFADKGPAKLGPSSCAATDTTGIAAAAASSSLQGGLGTSTSQNMIASKMRRVTGLAGTSGASPSASSGSLSEVSFSMGSSVHSNASFSETSPRTPMHIDGHAASAGSLPMTTDDDADSVGPIQQQQQQQDEAGTGPGSKGCLEATRSKVRCISEAGLVTLPSEGSMQELAPAGRASVVEAADGDGASLTAPTCAALPTATSAEASSSVASPPTLAATAPTSATAATTAPSTSPPVPSTTLDLSNRPNLTDLPDSLCRRFGSQILVLNLSHCSLADVPVSSLVHLSSLEELDLSYNKLRFVVLDGIVSELRRLRVLDLSHNAIRHISSTVTVGVHSHHLQHQGASSSSATATGAAAGSGGPATMPSLQVLNLTHNRGLTSFPDILHLFPSLERLFVAGTGITSVSASIPAACPSLALLNISFNPSCPRLDHLVRLRELQCLHVSGCDLREFPTALPPALRELVVSKNRLSLMPAWLCQHSCASTLEVLDLSSNRLNAVPVQIDRLRQLRILRLQSNCLASGSLPVSIGFLTALEEFDCSDNRLTHIPFPVAGLTRLKVLRLGDNELLNLPPLLGTLQQLHILDLRSNSLRSLPHGLFSLQHLHTIDLRRNFLTSVQLELAQMRCLRHLHLDCNLLTSLVPPCEPCLPDLSTLSTQWVRGAAPFSRPPTATSCYTLPLFPEVEWLTLDNNWIQSIPADLLPPTCKVSNQLDYPSEVIPGHLYLSSMLAAENKFVLQSLGITHVLTVARDIPPRHPGLFTYYVIAEDDTPTSDLRRHFESANEFIRAALAEPGHVVLVHCARGRSRSPTIAAAYLMSISRHTTAEGALARIRQCRPMVQPNRGFVSQLKMYERELLSMQTGFYNNSSSSSSSSMPARSGSTTAYGQFGNGTARSAYLPRSSSD